MKLRGAMKPCAQPVVNIEGADEEAELAAVLKVGETPMDLAAGPLFQPTLLRRAEDDHVLIIWVHHIITDGWSRGVFVKEFAALYEAYVNGAESPLEELAYTYADYAHARREWNAGEEHANQLAYWRKQLENLPPLQLPFDYPPAARQSFAGRSIRFPLGAGLSASLRNLCKNEGMTPFMLFMAAFDVLMGRYGGQTDFAVGTPNANRNLPHTAGMIGYFVNMLVMRADLEGDPTFQELLRRARTTALDGFAHQDFPFQDLVAALQPKRGVARSPLFQVMFAQQNVPIELETLPGLRVSAREYETGTARFDLEFNVFEREGDFRCFVTYGTDVFEAATIDGLLEDWRALLQAVVQDPTKRISELVLDVRHAPDIQAASDAPEETELVAARDDVESKLVTIWEDLFQTGPLSVKDDFFALGGHSLLATRVMSAIRDAFGADLPLPVLFERPTIEQLAALLRDGDEKAGTSCMVPIRAAGTRPPFFCVHPAPGTVFCYAPLAKYLGDDQPFYGIQARGVNGECEPLDTIESMAAHYVDEMRRVQPQGPYYIGGHSAGGFIAFEMARQLLDEGEAVGLLAISDTAMIPGAKPKAFITEVIQGMEGTFWVAVFVVLLEAFFNKKTAYGFRDLSRMDEKAQLHALFSVMRDLGLAVAESKEDYITHQIAVERATCLACFTYSPAPRDVPVTVFLSSDELELEMPGGGWAWARAIGRCALRRPLLFLTGFPRLFYVAFKNRRCIKERDRGWRELTGAGVDAVPVPGNHVTMLTEPHVQALAKALRESMDASIARAKE